jgi:Flp pilus assembly protein TadD
MYEWTLRLDPNRAGAYLNLARLLVADGRPFDAADLLRGRTQDAPTDIAAAGFLAELLSTHSDESVRNGEEAASLAARVSNSRGDHDAPALLIWATALAESGRFDEGIATARRALGIAELNGDDRLATELRRRLGLFAQHKPFHSGD